MTEDWTRVTRRQEVSTEGFLTSSLNSSAEGRPSSSRRHLRVLRKEFYLLGRSPSPVVFLTVS